MFSLKIGNMERSLLSPPVFRSVLMVLTSEIRKKTIKDTYVYICKEDIKLSIFTNMIIKVENSKKSTKK